MLGSVGRERLYYIFLFLVLSYYNFNLHQSSLSLMVDSEIGLEGDNFQYQNLHHPPLIETPDFSTSAHITWTASEPENNYFSKLSE